MKRTFRLRSGGRVEVVKDCGEGLNLEHWDGDRWHRATHEVTYYGPPRPPDGRVRVLGEPGAQHAGLSWREAFGRLRTHLDTHGLPGIRIEGRKITLHETLQVVKKRRW